MIYSLHSSIYLLPFHILKVHLGISLLDHSESKRKVVTPLVNINLVKFDESEEQNFSLPVGKYRHFNSNCVMNYTSDFQFSYSEMR